MDCAGCEQEQPEVDPGNRLAWLIFGRSAPGLRDSENRPNLPGLEAAFNNLEVPGRARGELQKKLLVLLTAKRQTQSES